MITLGSMEKVGTHLHTHSPRLPAYVVLLEDNYHIKTVHFW